MCVWSNHNWERLLVSKCNDKMLLLVFSMLGDLLSYDKVVPIDHKLQAVMVGY